MTTRIAVTLFSFLFLLSGTHHARAEEPKAETQESEAAEAEAEVTRSHGVSIFGELKYPEDFTHFDYVNPDAPKGGTAKMAVIGGFDSLNAYILRGVSADGLGYVYDTLLARAQDEPSTEYGLLASHVIRPADNAWVEFELRQEARWHDGKPVTVDDVLFSYTILTTKGRPQYKAYYGGVEKVEKTGEHRVRFTFTDPSNRELALIIGQLPILPKHYYDTQPFEEPTLEPPLGSGPYKVASAEPGHRVTYERVKDYWGKDLPVNKGRYNFDTMVYDFYRDETVAVEALKAQDYDFRRENISRVWSTAYDVPAVREGRLIKEQIKHDIPTGMQAFFFNTRRPLFTDRRVRKAFALVYDFQWANTHLFHGMYQRSESYFSNSDFAAEGLPSDEELALLNAYKKDVPESVFTEAFTLPVIESTKDQRRYLIEARALLEEAGWVVQDGTLIHTESGQPMKVEFLIQSKPFERIIAPYIKSLERLGVKASIRLVDSAQYQQRIETYDFDIVTFLYGQSLSPGNEQTYYWHSSQADVEGSRNVAGIESPAVDAMVESIINAKNYDELVTSCRALDRVLLHEYYAVPQWHIRSFQLIYWDKFGMPDTRPKYDLGFPDNWWIDAEKARLLQKDNG